MWYGYSMITVAPTQTQIALKEWAVVVKALKTGQQIFLLRKGGLYEDNGEFKVQENVFLLYPTFEHQNPQHIQFPYRPWLDEVCAKQKQLGYRKILFEVYARVEDILVLSDAQAQKLKTLKAHMIYDDAYVEARLQYKKDTLPLYGMFLRAYNLLQPQLVKEEQEYDGCRSWVTLKEAISIERAEPALADEPFQKALQTLKDGLA